MPENSVTPSPAIELAESKESMVGGKAFSILTRIESGFNDPSISSDANPASNSGISILINDSRPISGQRVGFADESTKEDIVLSILSINERGRESSIYADPDSPNEAIANGIRGDECVPIEESHLEEYQLEPFSENAIISAEVANISGINRDISHMSANIFNANKEPHLNDQPTSFTCITVSTPKVSPQVSPNRTPSSKLDEKGYIDLKVLPAAMICVEKLLHKIKLGEQVDDPIDFIAMVVI
jgi:hypothetical protein